MGIAIEWLPQFGLAGAISKGWLGLRSYAWQYGIGSDFSESGKDGHIFHANAGIFARYLFK